MIPEEEIAIMVEDYLVGLVPPEIIEGVINAMSSIAARLRRAALIGEATV